MYVSIILENYMHRANITYEQKEFTNVWNSSHCEYIFIILHYSKQILCSNVLSIIWQPGG